jgi:hypothetical protein
MGLLLEDVVLETTAGLCTDPSIEAFNKESAKLACGGIVDRAHEVLRQNLVNGSLPGVRGLTVVDRPGEFRGNVHTALVVWFDDRSSLVFDWHRTLDPWAPYVLTLPEWYEGR